MASKLSILLGCTFSVQLRYWAFLTILCIAIVQTVASKAHGLASPQIDKFLSEEVAKVLDKGLFAVVSDCNPLNKSTVKDQKFSKYFPFKIQTPKPEQDSIADMSLFKCKIELLIDQRVSKDMQAMVEKKIKVIMNIDNKNRTLDIKVADLSIKPIEEQTRNEDKSEDQAMQAKAALDAMKIENETAKLKNQELSTAMEREKLEATEQKKKLEEALKQAADKLSEASSADKAPLSEKKSLFETMGLPASIALIAVAFLILAFLSKSAFNSVGTKIAGSVSGIGDSIVQASQVMAQEGNSASGSAASANLQSSDQKASHEKTENSVELSPYEQEQNDRYLKLVEEKLTVLAREKNFNFLRHFSDLVVHHPAEATAIAMSLSPEISKSVVSLLNSQLVDKLAAFMSDPNAAVMVQKIKKSAIQGFYSVIVLDEFVNSPLSQVKDADWLFKLKSNEIATTALKLSGEEQAGFLSVFSSSRLKDILESLSSPQDRKTLFSALPMIKNGTKLSISTILNTAKASYDSLPGQDLGETKIIANLSEYLGSLVNLLQGEYREELLAALMSDKELSESLKDYFIPFSELELLASDNLYDIFGKRPAAQTAAVIFAESDILVEKVVASLPDSLQALVREEINTLKSDEKNKVKNLKRAGDLKNEITKTLIRLKKEGFLIYAETADAMPKTQAA